MALLAERHDPERMTGRAQAYLLVCAIAQGVLAASCIFWPDTYTSSSYAQIKAFAHGNLWAWGAVFALTAAGCAIAALLRSGPVAQLSLIATAVWTGAWGAGFLAAALDGRLAGPTGPTVWLELAAIHIIMCSNPIRTPFERIKRLFLGGARPDRR